MGGVLFIELYNPEEPSQDSTSQFSKTVSSWTFTGIILGINCHRKLVEVKMVKRTGEFT